MILGMDTAFLQFHLAVALVWFSGSGEWEWEW
jgi:hypothetical protein